MHRLIPLLNQLLLVIVFLLFNMFIYNLFIIFSLIAITGLVFKAIRLSYGVGVKSSNRLTFEEYSKEVDLSQKCKKVRGSDINLLKYLYTCLPSGADYLYGSKMTITEKMDGTQLWFRLDDKTIGDFRTHNGFSIGHNVQDKYS